MKALIALNFLRKYATDLESLSTETSFEILEHELPIEARKYTGLHK